MTTNVTDLKNAILASDSRWSINIPDQFIIYIDDTGFEKIHVINDLSFVFAGNSNTINEWKLWIDTNLTPNSQDIDFDSIPAVDGIAISLVDMSSVSVLFHRGQDMVMPDAMFAGTGAYHAVLCWAVNLDALKAVNSAKIADRFTGGTTKYVKFKCRTHNLSDASSCSEMHNKISNWGYVMYYGTQTVVPIAEAVANDPAVKDVVDGVKSGMIAANAPCISMHKNWSEEEKERLKAALRKASKK